MLDQTPTLPRRIANMTVSLSNTTVAGSELPLLLYLGSLTNTITQVVELGSADVTTGPYLDAINNR